MRAGTFLLPPTRATGEGSTPLKGPIRRASTAIGHSTYHPDDWESYMVRIGPGGRFSRASAHYGYEHQPTSIFDGPKGWGPERGAIYISGGSHAGRAGGRRSVLRTTKDHRLELVPVERLAGRESATFAITPPWRKRVYLDPEYAGTD